MKKVWTIWCVSFILYANQCISQNNEKSIFKKGLIAEEPFFVDVNQPKTDFYVIDGIVLGVKEKLPKSLEIISTIKMKDSVELQKIGVEFYKNSYTFYSTEPSDFYNQAYEKIRPTLPSALWSMRLPIILNNRLILPKDYLYLKKTNKIKSITFVPKNSPQVVKNRQIAYGAIYIRTE